MQQHIPRSARMNDSSELSRAQRARRRLLMEQLEERLALAAEVIGQMVFYNNSAFDLDQANNDAAIATDKAALMAGSTATFGNYTSYSLGLNGIMIDVAELATEPTLATVGSFFDFAVGNDDVPDDWEAAPAPIEVAFRPGEGLDGSDRVAITWEVGAADRRGGVLR